MVTDDNDVHTRDGALRIDGFDSIIATPEGSPELLGGRNAMKLSPAFGRNRGVLSGWQGQRAFDSAHNPKTAIFLEEFKLGKVILLPITLSMSSTDPAKVGKYGSPEQRKELENPTSWSDTAFKSTDVIQKVYLESYCNLVTRYVYSGRYMMEKVEKRALEVNDIEQKAQLFHELNVNVSQPKL
ncbi:hypothetical protein CR513_19788, partial [Mucuna pruriens]